MLMPYGWRCILVLGRHRLKSWMKSKWIKSGLGWHLSQSQTFSLSLSSFKYDSCSLQCYSFLHKKIQFNSTMKMYFEKFSQPQHQSYRSASVRWISCISALHTKLHNVQWSFGIVFQFRNLCYRRTTAGKSYRHIFVSMFVVLSSFRLLSSHFAKVVPGELFHFDSILLNKMADLSFSFLVYFIQLMRQLPIPQQQLQSMSPAYQ